MSLKMLNIAFASLVLTVSGFATAGLIVEENFETDGLNTRYTAEGAGGTGLSCCQNWSLNSQDEGNETDVLVGFGGSDFWSGSDFDDSSLPTGFSNSNPRNLLLNSVNIGTSSNELLTVALSASTNLDSGSDFLRVLAIDTDTNVRTVLDMFDGSAAGSISGITLGTAFQDISYDLSGLNFSNLTIGFEAWTTSNSEVVGIDNIRLEGNQIQVPEPSTLAIFALGMIGLASRRFKKQS